MNIRKLSKDQLKEFINSKNFEHSYTLLDEESKKILKPYIKYRKVSLYQKAKNLAKAASDIVTHGVPLVPEKIYNQRIKICEGCEFWVKNKAGLQECKICGCTSAKQRLSSSKCPLSPPKWDKHSG